MSDVVIDFIGIPNCADHNRYLRLLSDLEHTAAEGVQKPIKATVALREHTHRNLILLQQLNATQDGL